MNFFPSSKQIMWPSWQQAIVFAFYSSYQYSLKNQVDTFILKMLLWWKRLQFCLLCLGLILIFFNWLLAKKEFIQAIKWEPYISNSFESVLLLFSPPLFYIFENHINFKFKKLHLNKWISASFLYSLNCKDLLPSVHNKCKPAPLLFRKKKRKKTIHTKEQKDKQRLVFPQGNICFGVIS